MAKFKLLHDLYRFPGFAPLPRIRGRFGDPLAVVITLQRRQKKRRAACVAWCMAPITTSGRAGFAISPAATNGSISRSNFVGSTVYGVGP
jgi:hypothetical protein